MPESVLVQTAEACVVTIQAHDFGIEFESELSYADVTRELKDNLLHVDVVPWRAPVVELADRGKLLYEPSVDILVRKWFGKDAHSEGKIVPSEINRLLKLVQDIEELFTPSQSAGQTGFLTTMTEASWKETDKKMDYSRPHLYVKSQFTGWIRVTFRMAKEPG